ncbi:carboxypeptidase, partial [Pseudoalteromonas ruthenica]
LQSGLHAREYAPVALNLAFAKYLITNQGVDPEVDWILDNTEIHLLLVANPDGRKKAEEGLWWRKNTNNNYCSDEPNRMGVDLNRNYTFNWFSIENGSSGDECMSTFRGHEKGSEPEIQAIEAYVKSIFP